MAYTHEIELNKLLDSSEMTPARWRTWSLAALGLYIDGFDLFVIGVAMPLLTVQWDLTPILKGALAVSALVGAVFGAVISGYLSDRIGRKLFFTVDLLVLMIAAGLSAFSWNVYSLIVFRFILGIGVGAEYPVSAAFISEAVPMHIRGRMLIAGFSFQSLGMLTAGLAGPTATVEKATSPAPTSVVTGMESPDAITATVTETAVMEAVTLEHAATIVPKSAQQW